MVPETEKMSIDHLLGPGAYELRKTQSARTSTSDIVKASFNYTMIFLILYVLF